MKSILFLFLLTTGLMVFYSCKNKPSCKDGVQNGYETGVDCGGDCAPCPTCDDGIRNGKEKDVDCGGPDCSPCPLDIQWTTFSEKDMPTARGFMRAAMLGEKFHIAGGAKSDSKVISTLEIFDLVERSWRTGADMLEKRFFHSMVTVGDKLYVMGGTKDDSSPAFTSIERYDPVENKWEFADETMDPGRVGFGACVLDDKIYVIGGAKSMSSLRAGELEIASSVRRYDPFVKQWDPDTLAPLPTPRLSMGVEVWNGKIYVIGGNSLGGVVDVIEEYDPELNKWTTKKGHITSRGLFSTCVWNDTIFCLGGGMPSNWIGTSFVDTYIPQQDIVLQGKKMSSRRIGAVSCAWEDQLFVFGGSNKGGPWVPYLNSVEHGVLQQ